MTPHPHASRTAAARPLYYRPAVRASAAGAAVAAVVGLGGGLCAALVYAYADRYSPLVYANLVLTAAFGFAVGASTATGARLGKLHSVPAITAVAAVVTFASYYVSWAVWLAALPPADAGAGPLFLLAHPGVLWRAVALVGEQGTWSVGPHVGLAGPSVNGVLLALVWLGEAVVVFAAAVVTARIRATHAPFCDKCNAWCGKPRRLHSYAVGLSGPALKLRLEAGDWAVLGTLPRSAYRDARRLDLECRRCEGCRATILLALRQVTRTTAPYGKSDETSIVIMDKLLIGAADLATIEATPPLEPQEPAEDAPLPPADDYVDLG